ncbi:hypothetical protein ACNKHQ_25730 [Shigella flexneri]
MVSAAAWPCAACCWKPRHAAAGRTDQPPGCGIRGLAGALPARLRRYRRGHHPRPLLPRQRGGLDLELDRGEGIPWEGNYSSWLEQKDARLAQEASSEAARRKSIEKELEWVRQNQRPSGQIQGRMACFEELNTNDYQKRNETNELFIPPDRAWRQGGGGGQPPQVLWRPPADPRSASRFRKVPSSASSVRTGG